MESSRRLQRTWNPRADDFERVVPFTDPAQVQYLSDLSRGLNRMKIRQLHRDVIIDECVIAMNAMMSFLDGVTREVIVIEKGRKVVKLLQFMEKPIPTTEEAEVAPADKKAKD